MKLFQILLILLSFSIFLDAYESEDKLKTVITGKVAKYISWQEKDSEFFNIVVLNNQFGTLFDDVFEDKKIKSKPVYIHYIEYIQEIGMADILFISELGENSLDSVLAFTKGKNILTLSDLRGFAQKGGAIQFYFVGQKLKLKMNTDVMQEEGFHVERTLLKIVDITKGDK